MNVNLKANLFHLMNKLTVSIVHLSVLSTLNPQFSFCCHSNANRLLTETPCTSETGGLMRLVHASAFRNCLLPTTGCPGYPFYSTLIGPIGLCFADGIVDVPTSTRLRLAVAVSHVNASEKSLQIVAQFDPLDSCRYARNAGDFI